MCTCMDLSDLMHLYAGSWIHGSSYPNVVYCPQLTSTMPSNQFILCPCSAVFPSHWPSHPSQRLSSEGNVTRQHYSWLSDVLNFYGFDNIISIWTWIILRFDWEPCPDLTPLFSSPFPLTLLFLFAICLANQWSSSPSLMTMASFLRKVYVPTKGPNPHIMDLFTSFLVEVQITIWVKA